MPESAPVSGVAVRLHRKSDSRRVLGARARRLALAVWLSVFVAPALLGQNLAPAPPLCPAPDSSGLRAYFLNVGQGDATLLLDPSGRSVLIDAGEASTTVRDLLVAGGVQGIALVVVSHYHADHIGGLPAIFEAMPVGAVLENGVAANTIIFDRTVAAIEASGAQVLRAEPRTIGIGEMSIAVFPPYPRPVNQNLASIGMVVSYGKFRMLFTGDAESQALEWWVDQAVVPPVNVAKGGHHGSRNGTTQRLVEAARPDVVVVSVGANNGYGHPDNEAIRMWASRSRRLHRTDLDGTLAVRGCRDGTFRTRTATGVIGAGGTQ